MDYHGIPVSGFRGPCPCELQPCGGVTRLSRTCEHHSRRRRPTMHFHAPGSEECRAIARTPVPPLPPAPVPGELFVAAVVGPGGTTTPAVIARGWTGPGLQPWEKKDAETRADLAAQTPARLQRLMYYQDEGIPQDEFLRDVAAADRRLDELRAADAEAGMVFEGLTFAGVVNADTPDDAARMEYLLCDALIEYGNDRYGWVWAREFPVLDSDLLGKYDRA
ncbi:hypothetical protein ABT354_20135 [Streptomyces sp. NPDC000594]|uniref:hypothetical protein n=1 Tax=Streptomyces sp. NPDC000594 TaxID=3154261 RepID=UPI0033165979